jgi:hypothetical protein
MVNKGKPHHSFVYTLYIYFFFAGMKGEWDEGDGRILLGDNTGDGAAMMQPIKLQRVGVWISNELLFIYNCR